MIKLYTKADCIACIFTKQYLDQAQISYQEINVMDQEEVVDELRNKGFLRLPVIESDVYETFSGFDVENLEMLVEKIHQPA
ncbi:NrdH-redoxin [Facklamia sp. DSM 111018]|uniref:NrdH-redoxin n=1 Tax=Facklamia lactis TaxID=2749967 RepID=A0ABS0LS45_9LACT|nr:glutaredoxin domain-containing protein [Facklamia lactis]MBG9981189.1 NrdH-redoxin [Facklamia lactis]MBG9986991.1 NrdH-redoxin [Facklamia lactis]